MSPSVIPTNTLGLLFIVPSKYACWQRGIESATLLKIRTYLPIFTQTVRLALALLIHLSTTQIVVRGHRHLHHDWETYETCPFSGSTPDLVYQNLQGRAPGMCFNKQGLSYSSLSLTSPTGHCSAH